jgi:hypothetical protein
MNCVLADIQELGDLLVSPSCGDLAEHLDLPVGEMF